MTRHARRTLALTLLNAAAAGVTLGGCYDMLLPSVPANLLAYLGLSPADAAASPRLTALVLGLLRALGGCLVAIGLTALILINGPLRRGQRWASWSLLLLVGLSEGINASQMWRFGSPYYAPLAFIALTLTGLTLLPRPRPGRAPH